MCPSCTRIILHGNRLGLNEVGESLGSIHIDQLTCDCQKFPVTKMGIKSHFNRKLSHKLSQKGNHKINWSV